MSLSRSNPTILLIASGSLATLTRTEGLSLASDPVALVIPSFQAFYEPDRMIREFMEEIKPLVPNFVIENFTTLAEPPFIPKESHYERSHPKQPFYAKFRKESKRHKHHRRHQ